MALDLQRIQQGWDVYGSDGDKVGTVSEVGRNYILVSKGFLFRKDIYIPLSAITDVSQDGIYLSVAKDQLENMGWDQMPTEGATTSTASTTASTTTTGTSGAGYQTGTTTTATDTGSTGFQTGTRGIDRSEGEVAIPVVEEDISVGKREVEGGGVRVQQRVEETPVREQVNLREEQVRVERRPVDQPVDATSASDAFQEGSFEVRERREEAVVDKQARVVEEVVVGKEVRDRTETVEDTVRRTDVDVQESPTQTRTAGYTETTGTTGYTGTTGTTGYTETSGTTGSSRSGTGEGPIEGALGDARSGLERGTGADLDRSGDVGNRDRRDNF